MTSSGESPKESVHPKHKTKAKKSDPDIEAHLAVSETGEVDPQSAPDHVRYLDRSGPQLVMTAQAFSGPLPPPADLLKYNEIVPNGADRIMKMAELEQSHRHEMDKRALSGDINRDRRGQNYGLTIGVTGLVAAAVIALAGHPTAAAIIGGLDLVALVSVFVLGRPSAEPESDQQEK